MLLLVTLLIFTSVVCKAQSPQRINFQSIVRNTNGVIFSNKTLSFKISLLSDSITGTQVYSESHAIKTDAIGLVSLQIGSGTALSGSFATINWGNTAHFIKLEADFTGGNTYVTLGTQELMSVPYAMYAAKTDTASLNLTNRFAAKAPINNPQFTGTVSGIDKTMVGLENVNNTSDASKPVSAATQTELNTKVMIIDTMTMLSKYLRKEDFPSGSNVNEILYWNGNKWVSLAPGTTGQSIIMSSTGLSWGCIITNTVDTPSSSPNLLVNTALTNITIATTGATGIDTIASGLPAGVTAVWSGDLITISGTPTIAGTFNYTFSLTGGCGNVNATGTIIVTAPPSACPDLTVEDKDGNVYNTVGIGTQCWMKENLKVTKYNDDTKIPNETTNTSGWGNLTTGARAEYDDPGVTDYFSDYGYLYNWYAATDSRKICPSGWHVPTDSDWTKLTNELGGEPVAGTLMKKDDAALWTTNTGTNSSGFSALPGGYRYIDGSFSYIRNNAFFWSATEIYSSNAWFRSMYNVNSLVYRNNINKSVGASVRCLRD